MSFDYIPGSPEKSAFSIRDSSPPDRHFRPDGEGDTTSVTQPGDKPRYFTTSGSIVSDVVLITTPRTEPLAAACSLVPTSLEPAATPNQEQKEPAERSARGESHPPLAFDSARLSMAESRNSQASGLLSIITLPSFIVNDQPRPYSSSARARTESPVQPNNYDHKRPSIFGQRLSGAESILPLSLANSENTGGKTSRPTSGSLRIITSVFRRSGSTASSVRSCSPSSRRSSRRSLGRPNLSPGSEDEAAIQWKRLPPLPLAQGICTAQSPQSRTGSGVEEFSTERLPSCRESDPKSPIFLASHIPLPPSPSTLASSVSSINYASPSFEDIPPTNGFITPYASYPPLPPSIPPSPGQLSYPPTPNSANRFTDIHTVHRADRTVSLAMGTPRRSPREAGGTRLNLNTLSTGTTPIRVLPKNNDGLPPYGSNGHTIIYRRSASGYSRHYSLPELVLPSPLLLGVESSPLSPMSPRGPRPLPPTPGQLNRSATLYSQMT